MRVDVKANIDDFMHHLASVASERFPLAVVDGLNRSAAGLRKRWLDSIIQNVHRPTAFTKSSNAVRFDQAKRATLESRTFVQEIQSSYLRHIVDGSPRRPGDVGTLRTGVLVPVNARLTSQGNFPQGGPRRWLAKAGEGSGTGQLRGSWFLRLKHPRLTGIVLSRWRSGKRTVLAAVRKEVPYKPSLPLNQIAQRYGAENFVNNILEALRKQFR